MQRLDKRIVQQETHGGGVPCPFFAPEEMLTDITHSGNMRVCRAIVANDDTRIQHRQRHEHRQDETWNQSKHGIRPRERHDSKTNIFGKQQSSRALPRTISVVDGVARFGQYRLLEVEFSRLILGAQSSIGFSFVVSAFTSEGWRSSVDMMERKNYDEN